MTFVDPDTAIVLGYGIFVIACVGFLLWLLADVFGGDRR